MVMHVALNHRTTYRYDRPVGLAPHVVRLRPAPHSRTRILSYTLKVRPEPHFLNWQQDPHGNHLARYVFPERASELSVEVDLVAEMAAINPFDFFLEPSAEASPFVYSPARRPDLDPYLALEPAGERFERLLADVPRAPRPTIDFLVDLNQRVHDAVAYVIRLEPGIQSCEESLSLGRGSCRDSAWLMVQLLRRLGIAARFVSGYLIQLVADIVPVQGPAGPSADFTDLHAWAEAYLPGAGWVGLDPTSALFAGEGHIPLACTPDPATAAPISGAVDEAEVEFDFAMSVRRIYEQPRVTKPYDDATWQRILDTGRRIDTRLAAGDVRLTVGGEPTFVAATDRDAGEWNTDAVGPTKRGYADALLKRLQARFAPGGLLHHGQGKWYPGEQLPRWAFAVYWRADGEPLWQDPALIAGERPIAAAGIGDAERFAVGLTEALGVDAACAQPAFEDPAHFVLSEHQLPENLDPGSNRLDDPLERARMARVFDRGFAEPSGWVLPVQRWQARDRRVWRSERWATRRGRLVLTPGDSPVGFRLPLSSLRSLDEHDFPYVIPLDPFAAHAALPAIAPTMQRRQRADVAGVPAGPDEPVRMALSVEPRDGRLCVFMPPVESAEDYVDLIAAVEETAAATGLPVHVEGFTPPPDHRLNVVKVTPDPGVIEVNVQPSCSWDEQVAITEALYEEARQVGLDTCKFMIDGRLTGTGGGNHVVVGGATPADSPFLRRPDLLASLLTYWQNHPSLSYLFSGLFIGPTSQAPRIDEARHESLYELEIALRQVPDPFASDGADCPPWLTDRIFRNLLIDMTGNTHRAEICIDKLYSPDGPTGRLGLVEFRAFEMPPHARMSLAQQLVVRALIAWFWERPYRRPLTRWGTRLHDEHMLPHYVWRDFREVLDELSGAGLAIEPDWFATHLEFRFPLYGDVTYRDVRIELRAALEPWNVLGEEGMIGGTVRYVDSSVERLQIEVSNLVGDRFCVTCNGKVVPLQPTEVRGTWVAGVRFRAWQPPSCLHPRVGAHGPLVFDLVDRWNGRSLGGCTYHVAHPGGRAYDTMPVNDLEAEGRRLARFQPFGHTPGPFRPEPVAVHPDYPHTLDLRRFA